MGVSFDKPVECTPFHQNLFENEDAQYGTTCSQYGIDNVMVGRINGCKPNAEHNDTENHTEEIRIFSLE
jgi:hypothetical protein